MKNQMKKTVLLVFVICVSLFNVLSALAQPPAQNISNIVSKKSLPEIIPPSPSVASLMKFEEVPVDYYTGNPNISIPLYSKKLLGINYNLALNYNPSGVRVEETSSWVGTGWSLNEGGAISRSVVGLPDDSNIYLKEKGVFYNDYFDFQNLSLYNKKKFAWSTENGMEIMDSQMDIFQFNFLGRTGRFHVIKNNGLLEAKIIGDGAKLKIQLVTEASTYNIIEFTITDENGFKYTFNETETTTTVPYYQKWSQITNAMFYSTILDATTKSYVSAWKLKKIETPNNVKICEFYYDSNFIDVNSPINLTENKVISHSNLQATFGYTVDYCTGHFNDGVLLPAKIYTWNDITITGKKIKFIEFYDRSVITFTTNGSHPEGAGFRLDDFKVYQNQQAVTDINNPTNGSSVLNTHYEFAYETTTPAVGQSRLFLTEVKQKGQFKNMIHTIEYHQKDLLHGFGSEDKDIFGYYNGGDFANSNKTHLKNGVLKKITFPTGGVQEFLYESNTYGFIGDRQLTIEELFGNSDNRVLLTPNKYYSANVQDANYNTSSNVMIVYLEADQEAKLYTYNLTGNQYYLNNCEISIEPKALISGTYNPNSTYTLSQLTSDPSRSSVGFSFNYNNPSTYTPFLKKGFYIVRLLIQPEIVNPETPDHQNGEMSVDISLHFSKYKTGDLSKFLYGGGLRISEILFKDFDVVKSRTVFNYNKTAIDPLDLIPGILSSGSIDIKTFTRNYDLTTTEFYQCGNPITVTYNVTEQSNPITAQQTKGGYVGYKDVSVRKMDGLDHIGKTVYEYSSPIDYTVYPEIYGYPFIPVVDTDYKRGNLLKELVYNKQGDTLTKKINQYNFKQDNVYTYTYIGDLGTDSCPWDRYYNSFDNSQSSPKVLSDNPACCGGGLFFGIPGNCNNEVLFTSAVLNLTTGISQLIKSDHFEYFYENSTMFTSTFETELEYNLINNQVKKEKIKFEEHGTDVLYEKNYIYSVDTFTDVTTTESTAKNTLVALNRVNELLHTSIFKNGVYLNSEKIGYKVFSTNLVLPERVYTSKYKPTGGGMSGPNEVFEPRLIYSKYDNLGNPLEVQQENGMFISYIWGYNQTLPVAKIENLGYNSIPSSRITAIHSATSDSALYTALLALRNDAALANAMVTTFTHKPLVGVLTVTDPKGYVQSYSYDDFNRLEKVIDADGAVLSANQYYYRTQN